MDEVKYVTNDSPSPAYRVKKYAIVDWDPASISGASPHIILADSLSLISTTYLELRMRGQ